MYVFFDDSHHIRGGFSLGAFVLSESDPSTEIIDAIREVGLRPEHDEYKSRRPHSDDHRFPKLRDRLFRIIGGCRVGLMVASYNPGAALGPNVLRALSHIVKANALIEPLTAYIDQGIFPSRAAFVRSKLESDLPTNAEVVVECDSRAVPGIQLADLVAHACSIALLGVMGIADKTLWDENEGEYSLSFEMWARLRFSFLAKPPTDPELQDLARAGLMDSKCALYVASDCTPVLAESARGRFGQTWLGCIH